MTYPYELWDTHTSLGVFRDTKPINQFWLPMFSNQFNSDDEYIDFEKMPVGSRKLAALVLPLGRGKSVYDDSTSLKRFKPAYAKAEDRIDPLMPLRKRAGIDTPILTSKLTPVQRIALIRAAMIAEHRAAIERRWEWLAAKAVIDGKVTLVDTDYPSTLVDFGRDAGQTIVLGSGSRFGDSNVSAVDFIQSTSDTMNNAAFGAVPVKITMGNLVWAYLRKDAEFLSHLDKNTEGGSIKIVRGLVSSGKIFKVGEMQVGGASGQTIELWVNNETYTDPSTGSQVRYVGAKQMVFTGGADDLLGFRCFGRIIDPEANYESIDVFPKNYTVREGDLVTEYINTKSAPLMVPVNPNATASATVLA